MTTILKLKSYHKQYITDVIFLVHMLKMLRLPKLLIFATTTRCRHIELLVLIKQSGQPEIPYGIQIDIEPRVKTFLF